MAGWAFWIDRGGTFTDIVARTPTGDITTHKLLSENPEFYADAALQGIRELMGAAPEDPIDHGAIEVVKMGTTVATNALLERKGEPVVLVTNQGFADVQEIGDQNRRDIFALHIKKPDRLYREVIEISARIGADGSEQSALEPGNIRRALQAAADAGIRACAIVLMHAWRYPRHEQVIAEIAAEIGFQRISVSHQVSALIKLVPRGETTVADAYLSPILRRYVDRVAAELGDTRLMFMQSNGGLTDARTFQGKDSILSGPAGGIVGAVQTGAKAGFHKLITFDMGGTSTDVAHYNGELERIFDREVAGIRVRAPMMDIHTVAAGGGSIVHFDGHLFRVGPDSAGANPGPACYGRGGPLTVTDCNLLLGRLEPRCFPKVFGADGRSPLDRDAVTAKFKQLAQRYHTETGKLLEAAQLAQGNLEIAVQNMARAVKVISVQRGYDVTQYTLSCFGGAGGQLACRVADALGMARVHVHPLSGVLSALGMGLADIRTAREQTVEQPLDPSGPNPCQDLIQRLKLETGDHLLRQGVSETRFEITAHLKHEGADKTLAVPYGSPQDMERRFNAVHSERYGFLPQNKQLILATIAVEAVGGGSDVAENTRAPQPGLPEALFNTEMFVDGAYCQIPVYTWAETAFEINGPAMIVRDHGTFVVDPGWRAVVGQDLILERIKPRQIRISAHDQADPVLLEIFNNLFMSIAEQMGYTLENTSSSVNMKERLDFSCALFTADGRLIANAPHMPVHLGSMGESVTALIRERRIRPGQVYASNNPYAGGTHLPDITVIKPVFNAGGDQLLFFTAARGHHADIGGISPGSMPPFSTNLIEEGALLDNLLLVEDGVMRRDDLLDVLTAGPYPSRNTERNLADLQAQIAACTKGELELQKTIGHYGLECVQAYMNHIQDYAEACVRNVIEVLKSGSFTYTMDNGAWVTATVSIDHQRRQAAINFTGSSPQQASNFNAPAAVCKAAVLYVFRTLVRGDIPMNAGCLEPLDIIIPPGSMLAPNHPAAVVAGNVETSQVITDALYGALGVLAASQGTMNNLTFGDETHQYYETICGGSGAGPEFPGTDAVQTHMTNSRITDPEILEWRFPVVLETFAVRRGSGGAGQFKGGDGVIRRIRFKQDMSLGILANRRTTQPFGQKGGQPGQSGINRVERADGTVEELPACARVDMQRGDAFVVETPGGGGFGSP